MSIFFFNLEKNSAKKLDMLWKICFVYLPVYIHLRIFLRLLQSFWKQVKFMNQKAGMETEGYL